MDGKFEMKELYSVVIKPTYPVEIGGIQYAAGEVIASFDKICEYTKIYFDKLDDDFNTADAETQIYEIVRVINQTVDENIARLFNI